MAKLKDIVYGTNEKIANIFNGQTISGHTYNENDLYIEELDEDIEIGANGSGTTINNDNQLVVSLTASDIPSLSASKITSGTFADSRIASASTWNGKSVVSGTNNGTNWTSITINGTTKNIPSNTSALTNDSGFITNSVNNLTNYTLTSDLGDLALKDSASGTFTPSGSVSTPTITITPTTTNVNSITAVGTLPSHASDTFTQGSFTQGTFSQGTLPTWSASVSNEILSFSFSQGTLPTHASDSFTKPTFTQGTFSAGTLPTKSANQSVVSGIQSATSSQPTFTGNEGSISVQ